MRFNAALRGSGAVPLESTVKWQTFERIQIMEWIPTTDKLHPDKPGQRPYEQVPCLIVRNREILLRQWNCQHLVWDTEDGDDFYCEANKHVTHWMTLPPLPFNAEVSGLSTRPPGYRADFDGEKP